MRRVTVARLERALRASHGRELAGTKIVVFGATGVVGFASAVIGALVNSEKLPLTDVER